MMDPERDIPTCPWCENCTDDCECEDEEDPTADDDYQYELSRDQQDPPVSDAILDDDEPEDAGDSFFNELDPPDE